MKRAELIQALNQVRGKLVDIIAALGETPEPSGSSDTGMCPIHNVRWRKYSWGWAHPPTKAGEKWCKKEN